MTRERRRGTTPSISRMVSVPYRMVTVDILVLTKTTAHYSKTSSIVPVYCAVVPDILLL